jgi:Tfp pilus assembly protein FimT
MSFRKSKTSGFSKLELILWLSIFAVITFILVPFYNSWKVATSENLSEEDNNSAFHFESWNFGHEDSNSSED